jgi:hypothetical protein
MDEIRIPVHNVSLGRNVYDSIGRVEGKTTKDLGRGTMTSLNIHSNFLFEEYHGEQIRPPRHNLMNNGTSYKLPQWRLAQEFPLEEFQQSKF